jgi:hypothetical protein
MKKLLYLLRFLFRSRKTIRQERERDYLRHH